MPTAEQVFEHDVRSAIERLEAAQPGDEILLLQSHLTAAATIAEQLNRPTWVIWLNDLIWRVTHATG